MNNLLVLALVMVGLLFVGVGLGIPDSNGDLIGNVIRDNAINIVNVDPDREYPDDWMCGEISNEYMKEHKDWGIMEIYVNGSEWSHATNYYIIDDRLFIHDEMWNIEYELRNWRDLQIHLYDQGEYINIEYHYFYSNVKDF